MSAAPHTGWSAHILFALTNNNLNLAQLSTLRGWEHFSWQYSIVVLLPILIGAYFIVMARRERAFVLGRTRPRKWSRLLVNVMCATTLCAVLFLSAGLAVSEALLFMRRSSPASDQFMAQYLPSLREIDRMFASLRYAVVNAIAEVSVSGIAQKDEWENALQTSVAHVMTARNTVALMPTNIFNLIEHGVPVITGAVVFLWAAVAVFMLVTGAVLYCMWRKNSTGRNVAIWMTAGGTWYAVVCMVLGFLSVYASQGCIAGPTELMNAISPPKLLVSRYWLCNDSGDNSTGPYSYGLEPAKRSVGWVEDVVSTMAEQVQRAPSLSEALEQAKSNSTLLIGQLTALSAFASCEHFYRTVSSPVYYAACSVLPGSLLVSLAMLIAIALLVPLMYWAMMSRELKRKRKREDDIDVDPIASGGVQIEGQSHRVNGGMRHRTNFPTVRTLDFESSYIGSIPLAPNIQ